MKTACLPALLLVLAAGCAQLPPAESPEYAARMKTAGDDYLACMSREAEKDMKNPVGAEDIATAAHSRCWSAWEAYRGATLASYSHNARTAEQSQLAQDKTDAHLRQFEREARRHVVDTVVLRSLTGKEKPATSQ